MREEVLETALTYLGLVSAPETPQKPPQNSSDPPPAEDAEDIPVPSGSGPLIRILPDVRCSLSIGFYKSSPEDLAQTSDVVAAVLACGKKGRGSGRWACAVGEVVRRLGCSFTVRWDFLGFAPLTLVCAGGGRGFAACSFACPAPPPPAACFLCAVSSR